MKKSKGAQKVKCQRLPYGCLKVLEFAEAALTAEIARKDEQCRRLLIELRDYLSDKYFDIVGYTFAGFETVVLFSEKGEECVEDIDISEIFGES